MASRPSAAASGTSVAAANPNSIPSPGVIDVFAKRPRRPGVPYCCRLSRLRHPPLRLGQAETAVLFDRPGVRRAPRASPHRRNVLVGNLIQSISSQRSHRRPGQGRRGSHRGGARFMPGLIDNHIHIALSAAGQADYCARNSQSRKSCRPCPPGKPATAHADARLPGARPGRVMLSQRI